jgi:hypothetical protein
MIAHIAWFFVGFICCLWLVIIFSALTLGAEADKQAAKTSRQLAEEERNRYC